MLILSESVYNVSTNYINPTLHYIYSTCLRMFVLHQYWLQILLIAQSNGFSSAKRKEEKLKIARNVQREREREGDGSGKRAGVTHEKWHF